MLLAGLYKGHHFMTDEYGFINVYFQLTFIGCVSTLAQAKYIVDYEPEET